MARTGFSRQFKVLCFLGLGVLLLLACAPPGYLLQPVFPSSEREIHAAYRDLTAREIESLFVRPFTDRPLFETSGVSSALLFDYAYLEKVNAGKSGAGEALDGMAAQFIDEGISFRVVIWGGRLKYVEHTGFLFLLDVGGGTVLDPIRVDPVGSPEAEKRPTDTKGETIWHSTTDITFPIQLEPPLGKVVLLLEKDGIEYDRHTWKFEWAGR